MQLSIDWGSATLVAILTGFVGVLSFFSSAAANERTSRTDSIGSIQVYMTPDEARVKLFPDAVEFRREVKPIPLSFKSDLERQLGRRFAEDSLTVFIAQDSKAEIKGYVVISEEIGKYRPITFAVGIDPQFRVQGAAILVYRESRGGEVRRSRFLRQYFGKTARDPIRINRDIVNITGATLSVRSLNFGVKKLLKMTEYFYEDRGRDQASELP